jgi:hypothetical protein
MRYETYFKKMYITYNILNNPTRQLVYDGSQAMWDLWWRKWRLKMSFFQVFLFYRFWIISPTSHTNLYVKINLVIKTSKWTIFFNWNTCQETTI